MCIWSWSLVLLQQSTKAAKQPSSCLCEHIAPDSLNSRRVCVQMLSWTGCLLRHKGHSSTPGFLSKVEKKHCVRKSKQAHLGDCMVPDKETLAEPSHIFSSLPPTGLSNPGG